jgi:hypothetical protein
VICGAVYTAPQPIDVLRVVGGVSWCLDDYRSACRTYHIRKHLWWNGAVTQSFVSIATAAERVLRIVDMNEIDPADE